MDISLLSTISSDPHVHAFADMVKQGCREHGVEVHLGKGKRVRYKSLLCNGYFDSMNTPLPRLAVAVGKPVSEWLPILGHEYCHLEQWAEGAPAWVDQEEIYALDLLTEWFEGREFAYDQIASLVTVSREVERDCEARMLQKILTFSLPIDPEEYAQKANSYVFFYTAMQQLRKWYVRAPYEVPEVWKLMPKKLLSAKEYEHLPEAYLQVFQQHLF